MSNKQETVETVAAEMRNESHAGDESCLEWVGAKMRTFADRFEAAAKREVDKFNFDLMTIKSEQKTYANVIIEQTNKCEELKREVAELRECLKEAIREKCPFTRMSCKHGEPCDYECGTFKWRKALKGASND